MKTFRYRALGADGELCCGELSADSLADLERQLLRLGLEFINGETLSVFSRLKPARRPLSRPALIHFCFQLEQLLDAGVAPVESLRALGRGHTDGARLANALLGDIERGLPLSAAAERQPQAFPAGLRALLRASEASGELAQALRDIGSTLEHEEELARYTQRIALYPLILAVLLLLTLIVALTAVVPELEKLFHSNGLDLPWQTRSLIALSNFTLSHGLHVLVAAALAMTAVGLALRCWPPARLQADALLLRLPVFGTLLNKIALSRIAAMLARLYAAGINLLDALQLAADGTSNHILRAGVLGARTRIEQGQGLSAAFAAEALFPPLVETMLDVAEYSGRVDEVLAKLASLYQRDVASAVSRLQALLEPLLTIALGALLLWIASAVLGPVYALITQLPL